jgi:antitoxin ParD1/3/4
MAAQNISITPKLLAHAHKMVQSGKYANVSEYMRALVRRDQAEQEYHARLEALLSEGINSGPGIEMTPEQAGEFIRKGAERAKAEADRKAG